MPALAVPAADKKVDVQDLLRKGDEAVLAGKMAVARQAYERAIANGADLSTDYTRARNLGMIYMNGTPRDFNKAARWLDLAWKMRTSADDTRLLLAQALAWSGKYDAAIVHFRELVRRNPDTADYVSGLANTLYWAGKNDEAFAAYDRFLERKPGNLAMRLEYARVLSYARKLPEATLQYQSVLQADPQNVQAEVGLAKIASWQDDFKTALDRYNKVLKRHPDLYDAVVGKAYTLYWMGKTEEALPLFQKAIKRNPNDKEVAATLKEMGATAQPKKEQPPAEAAQAKPAETPAGPIEKPAVTKPAPAAEQATLQPETFDTHQKPEARNATSVMMDQAAAAANANNYVEAIHLYHQVLEREPQNTQAMIQIARVLSWSRNFKESAEEYDALLQIEPNNMQARLERARVLSWGQNYDASIEEYNRLIKDAELAKAQPPRPVEQPKPVVAQAPAPAPVQPKPVEHPPEHVAPVETPQVTQATKPTAELPSSLEKPQPTVTAQAQPAPQPQPKPAEQPKPVEQAQAQPVAQPPVERAAPEEPVAQPTLPVDVSEMHLELARVLAWSKRYDESLAQFNVILPPQQAPVVKDKPVLIEKARVLSWAQHYEEAVKTYDVALTLDPADIDARLGKGQTLYWWGRLDQAAAVLRPLMQVQALSPESKDTTAFTLAAVQHSRGKNGEALDLLNTTADTNQDAKDLRRSIRQDLRPMWRSSFGWEDDSEIDAPPTLPSVTRVLRWNNALSFNVTPDIRMTVANTVSHSTTSTGVLGKYGTDGTAYETEASIDFRANSWLEMIVGAGEGSVGAGLGCDIQAVPLPCTSPSGPRTHQFVYDLHPIITHNGWRFEFAAGRHIADYTPLAITANVVRHRWATDVTYTWRNRITYGGEYWHAEYALDSPQLNPPLATSEYSTAADGGAFWVTPVWYRGEHVTIDGGVRWEKFSFDSGALALTQALGSGGFFTPSEYERFSGNGHLVWEQGHWRLDVHGTFGPQKVTGFRALNPPPPTWGTTWSTGAELSATFGRFHPFIAYDWFDTATAAGAGQTVTGNGAYNSHSLVFGFAWRF